MSEILLIPDEYVSDFVQLIKLGVMHSKRADTGDLEIFLLDWCDDIDVEVVGGDVRPS